MKEHTTKATNPKDRAATYKRLAWDVIPWRALTGVALALTEGAWKYGRHNYRAEGVLASVYFAANMRHMLAWWEGEDIDPASGLHHLDKLIASTLVLRDAIAGGMCRDDRPPPVAGGWIERANADTAELCTTLAGVYGEPVAPCMRGD